MQLTVRRCSKIEGVIRPPADKSLTHRALMLAGIAQGRSRISNALQAEDALATRHCLSSLGVRFEDIDSEILVHPQPWIASGDVLDCGNSGTTMRLMCGLLGGRAITATLDGDASLRRRPMRRVLEPLELMGARSSGDFAPITIIGTDDLKGIRYKSPTASAQVKSAVLLAGLRAEGETWVLEPHQSRDHTERMLGALGVSVMGGPDGVGVSAADLPGFEFSVPGDVSSAAFWMVAAAVHDASTVTLKNVGINPTRSGVIEILIESGAVVDIDNHRVHLGEPIADVTVCSGERRSFQIDEARVPRLLDEIPVLAVLASQCEGTTIISGAHELRVKESDRIETVAKGLRAMGAAIETFSDGMAITGPTQLKGATIECDMDHRIAMSFAVAGLVADGDTIIQGAECIATSYTGFEEHLHSLAYG